MAAIHAAQQPNRGAARENVVLLESRSPADCKPASRSKRRWFWLLIGGAALAFKEKAQKKAKEGQGLGAQLRRPSRPAQPPASERISGLAFLLCEIGSFFGPRVHIVNLEIAEEILGFGSSYPMWRTRVANSTNHGRQQWFWWNGNRNNYPV
ncbi:hypothetical protein U1Q18_029272 [Sarracenia purpurea var. burkii]